MKQHLLALSLIAALPLALFGSPAEDHKIEAAAEGSYNYRTVLENHVKVKSANGVVTLSGTVQDKSEKELAEDTVKNLPGVTGVRNDLEVAPQHPERSDAWMAWKIRGQLLVKKNVSSSNTEVAVKAGQVTLTGNAVNAAQKELTGIYAQEIDGVTGVTNNMIVQPAAAKTETMGEAIDDASITAQVKYALLTHKSTSALKTKVTTTDGVIVITGEAASDAEKSLVTKLAGDVRGVKSVGNNMTVKG